MMTQLQLQRTLAIREFAALWRSDRNPFALAALQNNVCDCKSYPHFHQAGVGRCPLSRYHPHPIDIEAR